MLGRAEFCCYCLLMYLESPVLPERGWADCRDTTCGAILAKLDYDSAYERLKVSAGNLRCNDVCSILSALGFVVRDAKSGGHKTYIHIAISNINGNYNCGHGKDPQVKKPYIMKILDVLEKNENDIKRYLDKKH